VTSVKNYFINQLFDSWVYEQAILWWCEGYFAQIVPNSPENCACDKPLQITAAVGYSSTLTR